MMGMGGGMPSPEEMAKLAEQMPGGLPGAGVPGAAARIAAGDARPAAEIPRPAGARRKLPGLGGLPPDFPGLERRNEDDSTSPSFRDSEGEIEPDR